ncbi:MAG: hypothetical protein HC836_22640 [Richelia sp. RM2_1_2]|nr:hypothetical protein [Richelia sp. RM2_1_2]
MTHILVDALNLFHRAKFVTHGSADLRGGMALHIILNSINKVWNQFKGTHVVIALEGGRRTNSWRYKQEITYKAHREVVRLERTAKEVEEDKIYFEYINQLIEFFAKYTNCTILQVPGCEADDCIARWTQLHPDLKHVIVSSDTDYYQLLSPNIQIYNGITSETINLDGFFSDKGDFIINKKTNKPKAPINPEWELFKKCMLGDPGDGVFRAAPPRIRETKLREAWEDRHEKGFSWNNLMLAKWTDHNNRDLMVLERYNSNRILVDLTQQPAEIIELMDKLILESIKTTKKSNVGVWFMKFCHTYSLTRIEQNADKYVAFLNASYGD